MLINIDMRYCITNIIISIEPIYIDQHFNNGEN